MYDENQDSVYRYSNVNQGQAQVPPQAPIPPQMPVNGKQKEKSSFGFGKKLLFCIVLGLFFGVCAGAGFFAVQMATRTIIEDDNEIQSVSNDTEVNSATDEENTGYALSSSASEIQNKITTTVTDVTAVVEAAMPSLVSIVNEYTATTDYGYFGTYSEQVSSGGTGIIVGDNDSELLIVTNYHVVEDAETLTVTFTDDATANALVKGTDETMDIAVIAVDLDDLTESTKSAIRTASLGDSDSLKVGEPAIAIGNALGYGQSVTTGVISALHRDGIVGSDSEMSGKFIQTDAAINPGNSGGALLNLYGEVIGINSSKIGGTVVEGIGYAIPISAAKPIIEKLMNRETRVKLDESERGYIGITGVSVTDYVADVTESNMPKGVYVTRVYDGTAAQSAGIQVGDIITELGDYTITDMSDLLEALSYYAAGESVPMQVQRQGATEYKVVELTITLGSTAEKY